MEGFTYVDIFATKGIEYLLVIGALLLFVPFIRLLTSSPKGTSAYEAIASTASSIRDWFRFPEEIYYHQGHSWVLPEGDGIVKVGLDDFAAKLLGRVKGVVLPEVGSSVEQGEEAWRLDVDSKSVPMLSPISGEVVEVNEEISRSPETISVDPYEKGWLLKVRARKAKKDLKNLLFGRMSRAWLNETVDALREMMGHDLGVVCQDGGVPVDGMARSLDKENWDKIVKSFFLVE